VIKSKLLGTGQTQNFGWKILREQTAWKT